MQGQSDVTVGKKGQVPSEKCMALQNSGKARRHAKRGKRNTTQEAYHHESWFVALHASR